MAVAVPREDPLFPEGDDAYGKPLAPGAAVTWQSVENLALERPDEYDRLLRSYHNVLGDAKEADRDDIRISTVPVTRHLDTRRYGIGLAGITVHMGEMRAGEFVVVGAREGEGKTALGEKIALANCMDRKVLFVTLEMTPEEIRDRMLQKKLHYDDDRLEYARLEATPDYRTAMGMLSSFDLLVWKPVKKERGLAAILERASNTSPDLLIIDHARCIDGWTSGNRNGACDKIVEDCYEFAKSTSITTVLLSQLNRDAAGRRPSSKHFQDSGYLEQKAERCILLYRPFLGKPGRDDIVEVTVSKNRWGPCFRGHAWWNGPTRNFSSMDEHDEAMAPCCRRKKNDDD